MAQVFPTKSNLMSTKKSLDLAKLGYDLLDRKRNILVHEMMQLIDKASKIQRDIDETYSKAYLALQRANVTLGMCAEFAQAIPIDESLDIDLRSVMGVELPVVTLGDEKPITCRYADLLEPGLPAAREYLGDRATCDEDVLSYIAFPTQAEAFFDKRDERKKNTFKYKIERLD